ncbi:MAG: hypothetical protein REI45_13620, partial [Propionicimonas sp.]|nr:hypothetical protein [Propionicimonas sp.]
MAQQSRTSGAGTSWAPADLLAPVVAVAAIAVAAWAGRDLWFFSDDWNIYAYYHDGNLLDPFNGHLSLVPAGLYQLLFHTVGVGSYLPYRLCGLVGLGVMAFQVIRLTRSRLAGFRAEVGVAVATALVVGAILWNPSGTMNLLFPFLMNFTIPIAALAAVWWHLDRERTRNDVAASVWLAVALGTSGLGLMVLAAVGVELVVSRAPWRRWAILSPGPILWAVWFVTHRDANDISTDVGEIVSYSARMFLGATTSLAAGWQPGGVVLAVAFVVFVGLAGWRWRSLDARSLGALVAP